MLERFLQALSTDLPGDEDPAATRLRLKARFPAGAVRRMTQLGLLVGATLGELLTEQDDTLVYASQFGEGRALESYLDSFPTPSPTLFQTSIQPSGVQQGLIGRQQAIREVFPLCGSPALVAQALLTACTAPAPRVLFCGGDERGTYLIPHGAASDRTFAFACALTQTRTAQSLARLTLAPGGAPGELTLHSWAELLHQRRPFSGPVSVDWRLQLEWL